MNASNLRDDPALFCSVCNLANFAVNSQKMFTIRTQLSPGEVSVLASLLASTDEISSLAFREELPEEAGDEFGEALKCPIRTGKLSLGCCGKNTGGNKWCRLAPELLRLAVVSAGSALEQLSIYWICIEDKCMVQLCESSRKSPATLRRLRIADCYFTVSLLAGYISSLLALESLYISDRTLSDTETSLIILALQNLPAVIELSILEARFGMETCRQIGSLLALGRMKKLFLSGNRLGDEGISMVVNVILQQPRRCGLRELHLGHNGIGLAGKQKTAELVARLPQIRCLDHGESSSASEL